MPEVQAAYFNNCNRDKDEFGREVLNPAGTDLTPAAAAAQLGLRKYRIRLGLRPHALAAAVEPSEHAAKIVV